MRIRTILMVIALAAVAPLLRQSAKQTLVTLARSKAPWSLSRQPSYTTYTRLPTDKSTLGTMADITPENPPAVTPQTSTPNGAEQQDLPKLSASDFQIYNRLAVMMDVYVSQPSPPEVCQLT